MRITHNQKEHKQLPIKKQLRNTKKNINSNPQNKPKYSNNNNNKVR